MTLNPDQPLSTCPLCLKDEMPEVHPWDILVWEAPVPTRMILCQECKALGYSSPPNPARPGHPRRTS